MATNVMYSVDWYAQSTLADGGKSEIANSSVWRHAHRQLDHVGSAYLASRRSYPLDQYCLNGAGSIPLVENSDGSMASGSPSACLEQQWDVAATASDADTGAGTTLHQGIARRVEMGTSCS